MPALDFDALKRAMLAERAAAAAARAASELPGGAAPSPQTAGAAAPLPPPAAAAALALSAAAAAHAPTLPASPAGWAAARASPPGLERVDYVADAVTPAHAAALLAAADASPWVSLRARRLQQWGGVPSARGLVGAAPLPPALAALARALVAAGVFDAAAPPNHALVNHYARGEGIDAHTDGPCYAPVVATLSLGGDAIMRFRDSRGGAPPAAAPPAGELLLRARSLVVTRGDAYAAAHEIERDEAARAGAAAPLCNAAQSGAAAGDAVERAAARVSITLRHAWTAAEAEAQAGGAPP